MTGGYLASCCFSPDGKNLFFSTGDAVVSRYDLSRNEVLPRGRNGTVKAVAFSPDGQYLAAGGNALVCAADAGKRVHVLADDEELDHFGGALKSILSIAFSPDGQTLAAGDRIGRVRLWNVGTRKEIRCLQAHEEQNGEEKWVNAIAFSPSGTLLAEAARDGIVRLWDVAAGRQVRTIDIRRAGERRGPGANNFAIGLAFCPDGKTIALAGPDRVVTLVEDLESGGKLRRLVGHQAIVDGVAVAPDGSLVASVARDSTVRVWDTASGQPVHVLREEPQWIRHKRSHQNGRALAFAPDGRTLACGSWEAVILWDVASGQERCRYTGHLGAVTGVAFSPDGRRLATCSFDTTIVLWDLTGQRTGGE
jgi:WD40 repeat protein